MNQAQLNALRVEMVPEGPFKVYRPAFSHTPGDRTLIWGYDCDRRSFHVYLKDDLVHLVTYTGDDRELTAQTEFAEMGFLAPNKRLYPEACDYEFCEFLKSQGVHMSFTTMNPNRKKAQFYGRIA